MVSQDDMRGARVRRTREDTLNEWVAEWLNGYGARSLEASAEELGALDRAGKRADLIVRQAGRMPVVAEFEVGSPAVADAASRLGVQVSGGTTDLSEVLAVGYDEVCRTDDRKRFIDRLERGDRVLTFQVVSRRNGDNGLTKLWPERPIRGSAEDLVAYIEYLQVPQAVVEEVTREVAWGVNQYGKFLYDNILMSAGVCDQVLAAMRSLTGSEHVTNAKNGRNGNGKNGCPKKCDHDLHAVRTVCAIWMVAIDLQNDLSLHSRALQKRKLLSTEQIMNAAGSGRVSPAIVLEQWRLIAEIDYLPVIELAIDTLQACMELTSPVTGVLDALHDRCQQINELKAKHVYNFAGELWQRLVPDREERAAHYTKPHIAELLATLGAERFTGISARAIGKLNLMDAACGTGTLLGAGERAIRRKYYKAGGRNRQLHTQRMEQHIYAMDVNGIAGAMTAKRLTDLDLERDYTKSQIAVITHPAGSLILLDPDISGVSNVLGYKGVEPTTGPGGDEGVFHVVDGSIDWALMNPPYSRPRRGRSQETKSLATRRRAAKRRGYDMSHGGAGLATDFGDLSNIRLRPGGVFAHVLPLTAARASSWSKWRAQLERDFEDIVVVFAAEGMSSDTNLGEILVVATKRKGRRRRMPRQNELLAVYLDSGFETLAEGYACARQIIEIPDDSDRGNLSNGTWIRTNLAPGGNPWLCVGSRDTELATVAVRLSDGEIWDPDTNKEIATAVPMTNIGSVSDVGPTHDRIGHPIGGDGRGAFSWTPLAQFSDSPTQVSMWSADAETQTSIRTRPTHGGIIVDNELATRMIEHRSHWFIKRGMRWTSQATTFAYSVSIAHGGAAWTALVGADANAMKAVALFNNSVFGGIVRNAYGAIQQLGRAMLHISAIPGLPCPAFNADTPEAAAAREIAADQFDDLSRLELKPFAACLEDENRHLIDSTVAEMLGLDPTDPQMQAMLERYRFMFARQPNVHGGQQRYTKALKRYEAELDRA